MIVWSGAPPNRWILIITITCIIFILFLIILSVSYSVKISMVDLVWCHLQNTVILDCKFQNFQVAKMRPVKFLNHHHADLCCSGELLLHLSPPWLSPLVKRVNEAREIKAKKCSGTNPGVQEETLFVQSNKSIISRDERRQGDIEENKESSLPSPTTKC